MRILIAISCALVLTATGCSGDAPPGAPAATPAPSGEQAAAAKRGGTITVGDATWVIVPRSCQVYPGPIVNIWGSAESDPSLEITIDFGGPNQAAVGSGRDALWHAVKETLDVQVDGRSVRGTATFTEHFGGGGKTADGSFEVNCG